MNHKRPTPLPEAVEVTDKVCRADQCVDITWLREEISDAIIADRVKQKWGREFKLREELEKYPEWLQDHGYLDTDWNSEEPKAIDAYIEDLKNG